MHITIAETDFGISMGKNLLRMTKMKIFDAVFSKVLSEKSGLHLKYINLTKSCCFDGTN